jgi:hypothetical protein
MFLSLNPIAYVAHELYLTLGLNLGHMAPKLHGLNIIHLS